jgi:hypothetical protein
MERGDGREEGSGRRVRASWRREVDLAYISVWWSALSALMRGLAWWPTPPATGPCPLAGVFCVRIEF